MSGSTSNNNIIGSGSDSIVLNMAEDQAAGTDAQFTVNVDGQQIGGVQSITASQSAGQTEPFTFEGDFAPGPHDITVSFVNNFIWPGTTEDRNAYVDGVTYDGQTISNSTTGLYQSPFFPPNSDTGNNYGNALFSVNDTTAVPAGAASTPTTTPGAVSVGSGSDTLVLNMAEDPYQGDAQFTVSVDGQQIGGTQTTTAVVAQGQFQEFDVHGNFGSGTHNVAVTFTNDAIGGYYPDGTPGFPPGAPGAIDTEDRNLYVMGMSIDGGTPSSGAPWELGSAGTEDFSVTAGNNPSATASNSGLFGTDGAATTSDNAAIPTDSLGVTGSTSGSSTGMSFIASPTTSAPTASTSSTPSASSDTTTTSTGSTGTGTTNTGTDLASASTNLATASTDPTSGTIAMAAAADSGATQTAQDFSVPSISSSTGTDTGSSTGGTGSNSWITHQTTHVFGSSFQHHS